MQLPTEDLDYVVDAVGSSWEKLRGKRVLLTGGTGFVGKWLLGTFLHANRKLGLSCRALVLSRRPDDFIEKFPELRAARDVDWHFGDVKDLEAAKIGYCDFAIHAAADVVTINKPSETLDTCIVGTRRMLDAMSGGSGPRRVLLLSSGAVYGSLPEGLERVPEDWSGAPDQMNPNASYGEGKRISELLGVVAASERPELEVAVARCFAFVGPHLPFDKHFAIGNFIGAALRGEDIIINGDGTPLRSYQYAADLAYWLWEMLLNAPSGRAYNVGAADAISIKDLAHRVNHVLGGVGKVCIASKPCHGRFAQAYVPDISRVTSELGLKCSFGLDEAILRTARWARNIS